MGEMTLVSVLLLAAGGGGSYALGGLFRGNLSMKSFKAKPNEGAGMEAGKHGEVKPTRDDSDDGEPKEREMKSFDK